MHHSSLRRAGALLASGAVVVAGLTLGVPGPASAAAPVQTAPVQGGAQWLRSQLTRGVVHNPNFGGFDDLGLTVDFGLAMEAVGEERDVTAIASTISRPANLGSYIGTGEEEYAGATAKALLLAQAAGGTGRSFGGVDLVSRLESLVGTQGATAGRIADQSAFGDFANVLGQSYAVSSLDAAGSPSASSATGFLVQQQCAAGWFRLFLSDPTAADQSCDGAADATADVDATAVALMALLPQADDPTVADDVAEAVAWLLGQQAANGSFGGGASTEGANTNSTGLAGWALGLAGQTAAAARAADWISGRQVTALAPCAHQPLAASTGAIAYDDAAEAAAETDGITVAAQDQWRRASAQALPALRWATAPAAAGTPVLTGPTGYVRAGTTVRLRVTGLAAAEKACLAGPGNTVRLTGPASVPVGLPATTGSRTYRLVRMGTPASVTLRTLGRKTIPFSLSRTPAARGRTQVVRVSGLAAGESVTVWFRGRKVDTGKAGARGLFTGRFRVSGALGKANVKVGGQFPTIRFATKTFKVTR